MITLVPNNIQDLMLEIPQGNIGGKSSVNKFGRSTAITTGNTWEIWDGNSAYVYPATALMTKVSQTTDQGTLQGETIEVQGLDANWDLVVQNVTLNGSDTTTPVVMTTPLIRCFRMKVLADAVSTSNIRVHNDAENQDYAIISTGNNQTLMAIYTVPAGKTAYMVCYYCTVNPGGGAPTTFNVSMWAQDNANTYKPQIKHIQGVSADADAYGHFQHFFRPYQKFTEKTDIIIKGAPSGASVDTSAGFDLIIVDN